jgi:hypothetical protein
MTRAEVLKKRLSDSIDRELERCRNAMGDAAWREHGDWVKDYMRASAKAWLQKKAEKGEL